MLRCLYMVDERTTNFVIAVTVNFLLYSLVGAFLQFCLRYMYTFLKLVSLQCGSFGVYILYCHFSLVFR